MTLRLLLVALLRGNWGLLLLQNNGKWLKGALAWKFHPRSAKTIWLQRTSTAASTDAQTEPEHPCAERIGLHLLLTGSSASTMRGFGGLSYSNEQGLTSCSFGWRQAYGTVAAIVQLFSAHPSYLAQRPLHLSILQPFKSTRTEFL